MRPGEAVMELTRHGFRFRLDGGAVKVRFEGEQKPDPETVTPLLDLVRQHKDDVGIVVPKGLLLGYLPMFITTYYLFT